MTGDPRGEEVSQVSVRGCPTRTQTSSTVFFLVGDGSCVVSRYVMSQPNRYRRVRISQIPNPLFVVKNVRRRERAVEPTDGQRKAGERI